MPPRRWLGAHPEAVLRRLLLLLLLVLVTRRWICSPVLIRGDSMLPTLRSGQLAVVNKLAYRFGQPRRGDIVSVWTGKEFWAKRILGLPGEEIEVRRGTLHVNGRPLPERYVAFNDSFDIAPARVDADHFVVAGDNRRPAWIVVVSRDRIQGRLMFLRTFQQAASSTSRTNE